MRRTLIACSLIVLAACARKEAAPEPGAMSAGAPTPITLAELAGRWAVETRIAGTDSVVLKFEMLNDSTGWTYLFPGRDPLPARVIAVDADSVVAEAGPYESALRKGVMVSTHTVLRLDGGKLVGQTVATYADGGPNSVVNLETEGTRMP